MRKNAVNLLITFFILAGVALISYPFLADWYNQQHQGEVIQNYDQEVAKKNQAELDEMRAKAQAYNEALLGSVELTYPFAGTVRETFAEEYNAILNINGSGMMGYIRIPDINVKLPIYHGTSSEVLGKGTGHLPQTSLPIGGASTHTVLSAHTGNSKSELFTNLVQLKDGDIFYLEVLGETLAYKVDQMKVVEPTDIESLAIELSKDYVTLVTCTPYGINTYRLLVRGERTDYIEVLDGGDANQSIMKNTRFIIMLVCLGLLLVIFIVLKIKQKRRRK